MKISVMVPDVRSCSGSIMRRFVMMVMLMLRLRAERMAGRRGGEVRFGVRQVMEFVAVERRWRRKTFSGVGGTDGERRKGMGRGRANRWWGEGRRMVGVTRGKGLLDGGLVGVGRFVGRKSLRPQNECQNCRRGTTMGPWKEMQHSSQVSWLTLQLGRKARCRSTMTYLGCITLKGRRKMLLICKSSPRSFSGGGRPSFETHCEGG